MSNFVLTGSDVFGLYCRIEQFMYYSENEMFIYKVINRLRSNCWCEVPYKTASGEVMHDHMEDCVSVICCGIDETKVQRFRLADVEMLETRRERTCRNISDSELYDFMCSECGYCYDIEEPNYCPNCGSEIID